MQTKLLLKECEELFGDTVRKKRIFKKTGLVEHLVYFTFRVDPIETLSMYEWPTHAFQQGTWTDIFSYTGDRGGILSNQTHERTF